MSAFFTFFFYAGLVPDIRCDIDPSGRTDLLKILDVAENNGHITILGSKAEFKEDAILDVSSEGIKMISSINQESLLLVPVHMIASVGYVKEEELNILPLKIGLNNENFDLAVIYTRTEDIALEICYQMGVCFQSVYQESITSVSEASTTTTGFGRSTFNSADPSTYIAGSVSTSTTNSSRRNEELINEYITMVRVVLNLIF
uniref:Uncharacterized protein n=1 Tax=Panagrolaimus sp. PS1159 TaxID=55785 RepID=A0AC35F2T8_9BILA